ncbi:MAG: Ig domain-containing protein, partial [Candidatus Binatia bacterium]
RTPSPAPVPPSATPTRTPDRAPQILCRDVYRTFPGQLARVPIPAIDPDGGGLSYSARGLPRGAQLDAAAGVIEWTPGDRQVGAYYAPFTAADSGQPVRSARGLIAFQVSPLDPCTTPHCDAALGCAPELAPLTTACCVEEERQRLVEPAVECPGGRVLHLGRNGLTFGRLQNCDGLRVVNFAQVGALVGLNVEARCLNVSAPVTLHLRLETATRLLFDHTLDVTLTPADDGFSRLQQEPLEVLGPGPFFEFEGAEALLTASATDVDGLVLSRQLRLVLTFGRPDMLDDEVAPRPRDPPDPCVAAGP